MHTAAFQWVARFATGDPLNVLDIGGRDINGTSRPLFPNARYTALDVVDGPGVDIVANAATWEPDQQYDRVVCTEVFEHTPGWRLIIGTAFAALRPGGDLIATCAGPGRAPHSGFDGLRVRPGEWYCNVTPRELRNALDLAGFQGIVVNQEGEDVRAHARRSA